MTFVKFLNGDISYYDENNENILIDMIANDLKTDSVTISLIKNEEKSEEKEEKEIYIDFFVLIDDVKEIYILNMTQENFFSYKKKFAFDKGYMKIMRNLTKDDKLSGLSHWGKEDKIVYVPNHITSYVEKTYGRLKV